MTAGMEIVFWISLLLLAWTYFGYPVLTWLLAALRPRVVLRRSQVPSVTIIVVVRDGERWIEDKLSNCLTVDYPHDQLQVVLVSDGSVDSTVARARAFESPRVDIIECKEHRGKAYCINQAVGYAKGEVLVFTDVRQRLDRAAIRNLVMNFADETVGAVSGELVLESEDGNGFAGGMDLYWRYEKWIRQNEARFSSSVGVTGAIYALRRECYVAMPPNTVLDDVLVPMRVVVSGKRVVFDKSARAYDVPSASRIRERRRKIRTIAGNYQLVQIEPTLLIPWRNPVWLQFLSHKLLRLVAPFFLVGALTGNIAIAATSPLYKGVLAVHITIYVMALIGVFLPVAQRLRLVRLPATFLLLNWFAVLGLLSFARHGRQQPW